RIPEVPINPTPGGRDELIQDRLKRLDPPAQVEAAPFLDPTAEALPIFRRAVQDDLGNSTQGVNFITEVRLHGVEQDDFGGRAYYRSGGRIIRNDQTVGFADVSLDLLRKLAEHPRPGVLR